MHRDWNEWTMVDAVPTGWAHHGLALVDGRTLVGFHPAEGALVFFAPDGAVVRTVPVDAVEAHDIALDRDGTGLFLADCGTKLCCTPEGAYESVPSEAEAVGRVLHVDLDGATLGTIETPDHPIYAAGGAFLPTGVAPEARGLWVADGYGSDLVHLFGPDGERLLTLDGFDCPHGIAIDDRGAEPMLVIAERGARRLVVHDLDGNHVRTIGEGDLLAPCSIAVAGNRLIVADLVSRLSVFDADDALVGHVAGDREALGRPGWPNALADDGTTVAPPLSPERFNSPHGVAVADDGRVFVTEWLLGGRWVALDLTD